MTIAGDLGVSGRREGGVEQVSPLGEVRLMRVNQSAMTTLTKTTLDRATSKLPGLTSANLFAPS
jgi:hypothetical protein